MDLQGRVIVVTGSSSGIGWRTCARLAEAGARVVALARRGHEPLRTRGHSGDGEIWFRDADVTDVNTLTLATDEALQRYGRIDGLFANAGVMLGGAALATSEDDWRASLDVNLTGVWNSVRAVVPAIESGGRGGAVVVNSSVNGLRAVGGFAAYSATKFGVVGLASSLAQELGPSGIRVNTVLPTTVNTPMVNNPAHTARWGGDAQQAFYRSTHVLPVAWIDPVDVANAVLWLMSDDARYVTGATIPIDAGYLAKAPTP